MPSFVLGDIMVYVAVDNRISQKCKDALSAKGFCPIELPPFSALSSPVASHPDMLMFLTEKHIICHADYYSQASNTLDFLSRKTQRELFLTDEPIGEKYPRDILFNALVCEKYVFCKQDSISRCVLQYAEETGLTVVNVRQGYAKCSVCYIGENAIITADRGIAKEAKKHVFDVLEISPDGVSLDSLSCGFIGGATGVFEDTVYFCGSLDSHPNSSEIRAFCASHGKNVCSLSDEKLYDVGTMFFVQSLT